VLHARTSAEGVLERTLAYAGGAGCGIAGVGLLYYLATEEFMALVVIVACVVVLVPSRLGFQNARAVRTKGEESGGRNA
jgi:hypothetical protein